MRKQQIHAEVDEFIAWYVEKYKELPGKVLEIGSAEGGTLDMWCRFAESREEPRVLSIDLPLGIHGGCSPKYCWQRNVMFKTKYPFFDGLLTSSQDAYAELWVGLMVDGQLDLLFIDGDHRYEMVKQDFETFVKFVKPGGVVLLHDVKDTLKHQTELVGVPQLWKELARKYECHEFFDWSEDWGGLGAVVVP